MPMADSMPPPSRSAVMRGCNMNENMQAPMEENNDTEQTKRLEARNEYQVSIADEGHTLLNVLRYAINKRCSDVELCGYTVLHPSENVAVFRVQFKNQQQQTSNNVYNTLVDGLEYVNAIGEKLMSEVGIW